MGENELSGNDAYLRVLSRIIGGLSIFIGILVTVIGYLSATQITDIKEAIKEQTTTLQRDSDLRHKIELLVVSNAKDIEAIKKSCCK